MNLTIDDKQCPVCGRQGGVWIRKESKNHLYIFCEACNRGSRILKEQKQNEL